MKKVAAALLAGVTAASMLSGCSGGSKETAQQEQSQSQDSVYTGEEEWPAIGTEDAPVSVKVMIKDVFPDEEDVQLLQENIIEKMAAHGQYVDLEFVEPPAGSYDTAVPLAVMNGDTDADLIYFQGGDQAVADQGLLVDMTSYIENSTFVKSIMSDVNKTRMENYPYLLWLAPSRINIPAMRGDWAAQLDSYQALIEDPTIDNYYNMFKEMKEKGMIEYALNGDGSTDRFDSIFNQAFGVTGTFVQEDGKWIFSQTSQAEKDKLEFYHKLYEEGLLDPDYLTDTWDVMEQKFYDGETGLIASSVSSIQIYDNKMQSVNGADAELVILPPAKGVSQGYTADSTSKESRGFAINVDCENKDAAWAVLEFMASPEGRILDKCGIEGKHYNIENDQIVFTDRWSEWWARFWETTNNFDPDPPLAQPVLVPAAQSALDNLNKYTVPDNDILIPDELTPQWDAMSSVFEEHSTNIIRGEEDISAFDTMVEEWNASGGTEFESVIEEAMGDS